MAKNLLSNLLFSFLFLGLVPVHAYNISMFSEAKSQIFEDCDAPAPDSFRITNAGIHFVSLAWKPAWPGATQTIILFKKNGDLDTWSPIDTFPNVQGTAFTVSNLQYLSKYKVSISTNCSDGNTGHDVSFAGPPLGFILDLVMTGRRPQNPKKVEPGCQDITIADFNWIGFKVETGQGLGSIANFFEFGLDEGGTPLIKRPTNGPDLVAARIEDGKYPTNNQPKIELPTSSFDIMRLINGLPGPVLGRLDLTYNPIAKTVKICKDSNIPWAPGYTLTIQTAQSANGLQGPILEAPIEKNDSFIGSIAVENPFRDAINIVLPHLRQEFENGTIWLFDMNGQKTLKQSFDSMQNQLYLPVENLPSGFYLLRFEHAGEVQNFKILKSN